jgi:V/A-type H+-transporting ATPase subunit E
MEMQINDLVSAIKKEGVEAAQAEAQRIIAEAQVKAASIVSEAEANANAILKKAENEIEILKQRAKTTAEHAKRDAVIFFERSVRTEFERLLESDTEKTVNGETLAKLIIAALNGEDPADYIAEVAEVTEGLRAELAEKVRGGLEIKANPNVRVGFRLASKDGSGYFDCSDEEILRMLMPFFPELTI